MATTGYVALLRGINVGGKNKIAMADLRAAFVDGGYESVRTYIQSGNVLYAAKAGADAGSAERDIERMLEQRFGIPLVVVVRSHEQLRRVVDEAPAGFGRSPDRYHSDAIFLKQPLTGVQALRAFKLRDGVDEAWAGDGVVYFARLSAQRTKSQMGRIASTPEYKLMTIRSWNTTTKLCGMLDLAP